jgi:hypothetical protein
MLRVDKTHAAVPVADDSETGTAFDDGALLDTYDLCISNYAFDELPRVAQEM